MTGQKKSMSQSNANTHMKYLQQRGEHGSTLISATVAAMHTQADTHTNTVSSILPAPPHVRSVLPKHWVLNHLERFHPIPLICVLSMPQISEFVE